ISDLAYRPRASNSAPRHAAFQPNSRSRPVCVTCVNTARGCAERGMNVLDPQALAIIEARHADPFCYLGPHAENGAAVVRAFLPDAEEVCAIDEAGLEAPLARLHPAGLFAG